MKLRLDPWPAEYDAPVQVDGSATKTQFQVNAEVETSDWRPVPAGAAIPERCAFVDGVRRLEARVLAEQDGAPVHGLFGSLATGAVVLEPGRAVVDSVEVERYLILGNGHAQEAAFAAGSSVLRFAAHAATENTPDAVLGELQNRMRSAEWRMAERAAAQGCVFMDGLRYRSSSRDDVIGVVKRILEMYLAPAQFALAPQLAPGERTPLFTIEDGQVNRYSCYLRLAKPGPLDHTLAGIIRLEFGAAVGLERAVMLAGFASALLPRLASTSVRDPRAPQNLLPVGALETEMRRRMGDPTMIRRAIERGLFQQ